MPWPLMSCGMPTTAASATLACSTSALSTSAVPMRWPRDVDHVVDPAGDPVIAVLVAAAAVAGEIFARIGGEIGLEEAVVIAPDGAHLARPALRDDQIALGRAVQHLALGIDESAGRRPGSGMVAEPGLEVGRAGQRRDHVRRRSRSATRCRRSGSGPRRRRRDTSATPRD